MNDGAQETRVAAADDATEIVAFKGFDSDLRCRGFQFEVGKTYTHDGAVEICASGFHACEYPLDVFGYYPPAGSRFALVRAEGNIACHSEDSKIACASLTIEAELRIPDLVTRAIEWILARVDRSKEQTTIGLKSVALNSGLKSVALNSGGQSVASNSGVYSVALNSGLKSVALNSGGQSVASNSGWYSVALNSGGQSVALNSGGQSVALNSGLKSVALNSGAYSVALNSGGQSVALNSGWYSVAEVSGNASVAIAVGTQSRARASVGGAICLVNRADDGSIRHIRAARVGDGIKPGTWYVLNAAGEFEEAA